MDYFRDMVEEQVIALRGLWRNKRQMTVSVLNLAMIVFSALMIWKAIMVVTESESPVVVVLSGSMEPAFQRGDILFLDNRGGPGAIVVGDIVVFKIAGRDVPIVHRVHRKHDARADSGNASAPVPPPGSAAAAAPVAYLTKGDANVADDRDLYAPGQLWLTRGEIVGKAVLYVPYLGMFTILLNDYPALKVGLIGLMGLFVLTGKET